MFNIFKFYDEMLGMLHHHSEEEINTTLVTKEIPEDLAQEFNCLIDNWLVSKGYDPADFEYEEDKE